MNHPRLKPAGFKDGALLAYVPASLPVGAPPKQAYQGRPIFLL